MAFTPNSGVWLLATPLDNTYKNQLHFDTKEDQYNYFSSSIIRHSFVGVTYQRKDNVIRVDKHIDELWDVNYVAYQNTNFGNKWFYAFITKMEYVNDRTTEIYIETDVYQTWLFDTEVKTSFVIREHVADDSIGNNLVEEGLNCGDYTNRSAITFSDLTDLTIVVSTTTNFNGSENAVGASYTGVYSGTEFMASPNASDINNYIDTLNTAGKTDAIVNIFMMPKNLISTGEDLFTVWDVPLASVTHPVIKPLSDIDGYTPKNNKLFCYPYNFLMVDNNHGNQVIYHYEYFEDSTIEFSASCEIGESPTVYLFPPNYKGLSTNKEEVLTLSGYPLCSWNADIYKIWKAQNAVTAPLSIMGGILSVAAGAATGNPIGVASGVLGIANSIGQFYEKSLLPNENRGQRSGGANIPHFMQTFIFYQKSIRAEFAKRIDDFFSMFGYKVNALKVPELHSRQNWNYVQTIDVNITGDIPANDMVRLKKMYDEGVTLWHNVENFANYDADNSII